MPTTPIVIVGVHRPTCYSVTVIMRYAFRVYPTSDQAQMLARTFGCVRRVYNDAITVWDDAYRCSTKVTDVQVQNRVITQAKAHPDRLWLSEVSSVALVQSFQDARKARRNFFDSRSGKRKGAQLGGPRRKSKKDNRQSVRFTRNGFSLKPDGTLYVAKVGDLEVRWSRDLPSVPSSVTVTREPDGRYYASFVVDVPATPLPATTTDVGIDLGLTTLAVMSDGSKVENIRPLKAKARNLARAQRRLSRKQKGSKNRAKAATKVAVIHRKIHNTRADYLHKTALHLVRDNQSVYVEDLSVKGLARTRLAKSVHDASWGMLVRLLEEKAVMHGRTVVKVGRWFPSSQFCSACGVKDGKKPLQVREWTCKTCGTAHDRDLNAARNILFEGRKTAAGPVASVCGADVSPGLVPAVGREAETLVA
jgi:putative transposase